MSNLSTREPVNISNVDGETFAPFRIQNGAERLRIDIVVAAGNATFTLNHSTDGFNDIDETGKNVVAAGAGTYTILYHHATDTAVLPLGSLGKLVTSGAAGLDITKIVISQEY